MEFKNIKTVIPAPLMNIINQATNYITGDSKYDLIITVNMTSMVVLATIYMSVSMSLPNTPGIKPVEVWLFFSIAYPFWVIITNVVMQVSRNCKALFKTLFSIQLGYYSYSWNKSKTIFYTSCVQLYKFNLIFIRPMTKRTRMHPTFLLGRYNQK